MSVSKRIEGEFINKFGQRIQPGDKVIFITTSTSYTNARIGNYIGYIKQYRGSRAQVKLENKSSWARTDICTLWDNNIFPYMKA